MHPSFQQDLQLFQINRPLQPVYLGIQPSQRLSPQNRLQDPINSYYLFFGIDHAASDITVYFTRLPVPEDYLPSGDSVKYLRVCVPMEQIIYGCA